MESLNFNHHLDGVSAKKDTDKAFDENAPVYNKINWGGKNKQTKFTNTKLVLKRAKKAVFGEDDEKPNLLGYGWCTSRL